jgi:hypothetical protein
MIKKTPILHNVRNLFPLLKEKLEKEKDIIFAYIFGSYGRDNISPLSDVDIAVYLTDSNDFFQRKIELNLLITEVLKTDEVDIVIMNDAPLEFAFNVLKTGSLLFSKDESLRINYEIKIIKFYQDFKFYRERMIKDYIKKIKEELESE